MRPIKSIFLLMLLSFAYNIYATDGFQFNPQLYSAHLDTAQVYFIDKSTNTKTGPELYADETNAAFFDLVKTMISDAVANNKSINLQSETKSSQNHGQYECIIPDF